MDHPDLKLSGGATFAQMNIQDSIDKRGTQRLNESEVLLTPDDSNVEIMLVGKNNMTP